MTNHTILVMIVNTPAQHIIAHFTHTKHTCKSHNTNDQVNEIIGQTHKSKNAKLEPEDIKDSHESDSSDSNIDSSSDSE